MRQFPWVLCLTWNNTCLTVPTPKFQVLHTCVTAAKYYQIGLSQQHQLPATPRGFGVLYESLTFLISFPALIMELARCSLSFVGVSLWIISPKSWGQSHLSVLNTAKIMCSDAQPTKIGSTERSRLFSSHGIQSRSQPQKLAFQPVTSLTGILGSFYIQVTWKHD